jgi:hypothetical protein
MGVSLTYGVVQHPQGVLSVRAIRAEALALAPEVAALTLPASHDFH